MPRGKKKKKKSKKKKGKNKVERVKTGIPGLDKLIEGGFVKGSSNLVMGGPGTGKTIMGYQFLWQGLQDKEPVLFVSFENTKEAMLEEAQDFKFNFDDDKNFNFMHIELGKLAEQTDKYQDIANNIIEQILEVAEKNKVQRIVIDSMTVFGLFLQGDADYRRRIYDLMQKMQKLNATMLFVSEEEVEEESKSFGTETYAADGIVMLHFLEYATGAKHNRSLKVRKMRRTDADSTPKPFEISDSGISVTSE